MGIITIKTTTQLLVVQADYLKHLSTTIMSIQLSHVLTEDGPILVRYIKYSDLN
jgi:hypothetical protein